jgi:DNA-binding FadR family transcriptional regulator
MRSLEKALEAILDAPAGPGRRLPTERSLAAQFGATRHAVRKALDQLEAKGKLWRHVGRGTFAGRRQMAEPGNVSAAVPFARPRDIVEARQVMEPQLAALAALRASSAQLDTIENAFRRCSSARNIDQYEVWDEEFHRSIAAAAGNIVLQSTFEAVNKARKEVVWGAMRGAVLRPERRQLFSDEHERVVVALKARNAEGAWEAMRAHIATTTEVYAALENALAAGRGPIAI